ncbi:hypothetical protein AO459_07085 [Oenococcus oeni]|nr:hypothetical protein AO459_07085 [Oenococcus oeni]
MYLAWLPPAGYFYVCKVPADGAASLGGLKCPDVWAESGSGGSKQGIGQPFSRGNVPAWVLYPLGRLL